MPERASGLDRTLALSLGRSYGGSSAAALLLALSPSVGAAVTISVVPPPPYEALLPSCSANAFKDCKSAASISATPLTGDNATFKKEFDAWNADTSPNGGQGEWSLKNGGALPNNSDGSPSTLTVSTFQAEAFDSGGGLKIRMAWNYDGANKADFYWTQGLYDNYAVDMGANLIVAPHYKLDVDYTEKVSPPLYPFQGPDKAFFDEPSGPWPNAFFEATLFLSAVDFEAETLTVYEGISYGFQLSACISNGKPDNLGAAIGDVCVSPVPEPSSLALFASGLGALLGLGMRFRRSEAVGRRPR